MTRAAATAVSLALLTALPAFAIAPVVSIDGNQLSVQKNATVTTSGSSVVTGFNNRQVDLFVNITASPTGTTPTITYSLQEVDPGDKTTLIGASTSTSALNAISNAQLSINATLSPFIKVTWTVTGTSPSFTGVYTTVRSKPDPTAGNSSSSQTLSTACADPGNGCASTSFISINTAGQFGAWFSLPSSHNIVGGTAKAECSGNGTSWLPTQFDDGSGNKVASKALTSGTAYDASIFPCRGQQYSRVRISAITSGTGAATMYASLAQDPSLGFSGVPGGTIQPGVMAYVGTWDGVNFNPFALGQGPSNADTQRVIVAQKATHQAVSTRTATAAGTGVFFNICGSATKTVRLQYLFLDIQIATTTINSEVVLTKTSAATTAGTATTLTNVPEDSSDAASTAVVKYYTALGTAGTAVGKVDDGSGLFPVTASPRTTATVPVLFDYRDRTESETHTLRGTAQCIEAAFAATTTNAPTIALVTRWTEE